MAQNFKNQLENVSNVAEDILDAVNSFDAVVGIRLVNVASSSITVDVYIVRSATNYYLIKSAPIGVGQSLELIDGGSKIVLQSGDKIMAISDTATSLDTVVSYVDAIST